MSGTVVAPLVAAGVEGEHGHSPGGLVRAPTLTEEQAGDAVARSLAHGRHEADHPVLRTLAIVARFAAVVSR
jgi:hypothetical protein